MPALSKQTIVTQLVESLVLLKDFPIQSIDEFNDFIAKSTFKFNKPKNPSSSTRKTSPYHCFLKHNKGTDTIQNLREQWTTIKSDESSSDYLYYLNIAQQINLTKTSPQALQSSSNLLSTSQQQPTLQPHVEPHVQPDLEPHVESDLEPTLEEQLNDSDVEPHVESDLEPHVESDVEPHVESDLEPNMEPTLEEQLNDSDVEPDVEPDLEPTLEEQLNDSDLEPDVKSDVKSDVESNVEPDVEPDVKSDMEPTLEEQLNDSDMEPDDDLLNQLQEDSNVSKPVYTGKKPETALNNYKEWKKNQLGLSPEQSIKRNDLNDYKITDNYDSTSYNDSPWFEYIINNMDF